MNKLLNILFLFPLLAIVGCGSSYHNPNHSFNANVPMEIKTKITRPSLFTRKQDAYGYGTYPERFMLGLSYLSDSSKDLSHRGLINSLSYERDYSSYFRNYLCNKIVEARSQFKNLAEPIERYTLNIELDYGLSKQSGMPEAKLSGILMRKPDYVVIWQNHLTYQTESDYAVGNFKNDDELRYFWQSHSDELAQLLKEANIGLAQMLANELLDKKSYSKKQKSTLLRMKSGEIIRASIVSVIDDRIIIRSQDGSLVNMPRDSIYSRLKPVFSLFRRPR